MSLKQYAYFKKVKRDAVSEREKLKERTQDIKAQTQRYNIDRLEKYMKINEELHKYRVFKALKFHTVKSKNARRFAEAECERYLNKKNLQFIREVFSSWKIQNLKSLQEQKQKLNKFSEGNFRKNINQAFSAWAKVTKKLKITRKIGEEVKLSQIERTKLKTLEAWKRVFMINQIANVFQYHYKRKLGFRVFKVYLQHQNIKRALYHQCVQHRNKYIMKEIYSEWRLNAKENAYMRYVKIHKFSKMDKFKKQRVFISWIKCTKDSQDYRVKELVACQYYTKTIFHAFKKGCVRSANEEEENYKNSVKQAIIFRRKKKLAYLDEIFQAWKDVHAKQISFQQKIEKIKRLRSLHISKVVYSSWARYTYKHEKYRKQNQIACIFYLKNLYQRYFIKGLKLNYELNSKSKKFERRKFMKVASE